MSTMRSLPAVLLLFATALPAQSQPSAGPLSADSVAALRDAPITVSALQRDLALLDTAFRALHPGLFRYQSRDVWAARVDSLHRWFAEPRSRGASYLAFSHLVAAVQCGHTYLNFWNQSRSTRSWLTDGADKLPFEFALTADDGWRVERTLPAPSPAAARPSADAKRAVWLRVGDTVVAVNDVPTRTLIARLLPYVRGDGDANGKRRALLDFRHRKTHETIDVLLPLITPPLQGMWRVTFQRAGRTHTITMPSASAQERRSRAMPTRVVEASPQITRRGDVAVLRIDGFDYEQPGATWEAWVRTVFADLRRAPTRALIVDLRENEGGSDAGALFLLQHLLRAPVTLPPLARVVTYDTVPTSLRAHLDTWDKEFFDRRGHVQPRADGRFDLLERGAWPAEIAVARDAYTGPIFVLTSYVNSSASHILLRLLARQPGVTLVGEPTGGSLRAHTGGNLFFLRLPGSGFEVDVPLIGYEWDANAPSGGVQPDIPIAAGDAMARALELARTRTPRT